MALLRGFSVLANFLLLLNAVSAEENIGYRRSGRPTTEEEWRNEHQYEGRNAGGWRHANWEGGVYPKEQHSGGYGEDESGWGWGFGPQPYDGGSINDNGSQYYDPNYYNEHPYESSILHEES